MKTNETIKNMCASYLEKNMKEAYNLNKHIAKNILVKIERGIQLSMIDLDFITGLQCGLI